MNPELRRNLWLEATPRKLALAGAVVAGVFAAVWLLDRGRHAYAVTFAGAGVFAASALGLAPRAARRSVTREAVCGSWDFQRLSALTPWAMTWGKLAGSTARLWAAAGGGLLLAALQLASTTSFGHTLFWILVALALALTLQAAGLATGLIDIRRARASGRPLSGRSPGLLVLGLGLVTLAALVWARSRLGRALDHLGVGVGVGVGIGGDGPGAIAAPVAWLGHAWPPLAFATLTLAALAGWSLIWAWRLMRLELQHVNSPWAWCGFLGWAGLYVAAFDPSTGVEDPFAARFSAAAGIWALLAYIAAFVAPADRVRARQFARAVGERRLGLLLSHLPLTVAPAAAAVAAAGLVVAIRTGRGEPAAALAVLVAIAFFARDLGVIAWGRFGGRGRRGDGGVLLVLAALYALAAPLAWLAARDRGLALFWPSSAHPRLSLISATIEACLAWALAAEAVARPTPKPRPEPSLPEPTPGPPPEGARDLQPPS